MQLSMEPDYTSHFGFCPICRKADGCLNIGKGHWLFCVEHKVRWFVGSNLFSSWRDETEQQQRDRYDALDFGNFKDVVPFHPTVEEEYGDQTEALVEEIFSLLPARPRLNNTVSLAL